MWRRLTNNCTCSALLWLERDILCKYIKNMFFTYFGHFWKIYIFWDFLHILTYFVDFDDIFLHILHFPSKIQKLKKVKRKMLKKFWKNFEFFLKKYEKLVKIFSVEENFFNTWTFCFQTLVMSKGNQDVYKNGPPKTQKWPFFTKFCFGKLHIFTYLWKNYIFSYIFWPRKLHKILHILTPKTT